MQVTVALIYCEFIFKTRSFLKMDSNSCDEDFKPDVVDASSDKSDCSEIET